jgi:hypothetical protein
MRDLRGADAARLVEKAPSVMLYLELPEGLQGSKIPFKRFKANLVITRKGRRRVWQWQIQRRPPTGNRLHADGFKTDFEARLAGEKVLQALVSQIDGP